MKTEEKAKAYDEALNWMRELYPGLHGATKEDAEHYFPELRESEDERIRKGMIRFLESEQAEGMFTHEARLSWIAYLEKQKDHFRDDTKMVEQKPRDYCSVRDNQVHRRDRFVDCNSGSGINQFHRLLSGNVVLRVVA